MFGRRRRYLRTRQAAYSNRLRRLCGRAHSAHCLWPSSHITRERRLQFIAFACKAQEAESRVTSTLEEIAGTRRGARHRRTDRPQLRAAYLAGWRRATAPGRAMATQSRPGASRVGQCDLQLYRRAPKNAVLLSIDEKSGVQAIERKHLSQESGAYKRGEYFLSSHSA